MAEKRVSVRLVAEGGRQVRAELEGIGDAGARGFGRLSTEMELTNTRLASFARKAGIALAAVTVAAAAAGVAMVRSGLEIIGAQADMAASLKINVESLQVLTWAGELAGVSMGEIEQATKKLTTRLSEAAARSGSAVGALQRLNRTASELQAITLDHRIVAIQEALNRFVPEAERAAVASDLFGDKAALAFLRIDPATLREAAQDVRDFGVAVSASDAAQIERTGDAIAKLSLIWLGLTNRLTAAVAPALETGQHAGRHGAQHRPDRHRDHRSLRQYRSADHLRRHLRHPDGRVLGRRIGGCGPFGARARHRPRHPARRPDPHRHRGVYRRRWRVGVPVYPTGRRRGRVRGSDWPPEGSGAGGLG
jgi:hypothetical protein